MIYERLTGVLADVLGKPWNRLQERHREAWHKVCGTNGDDDCDGKLWNARDKAERKRAVENYDYKNDPAVEEEIFVGHHEGSMNASAWFDMPDVLPRHAAMVLCRLNPLEKNIDPESASVDGDVSSPERYGLLLEMFDAVARAKPKHRTLMEWRAIAREKSLSYHEWIDRYVKAAQVSDRKVGADGAVSDAQKVSPDGMAEHEVAAIDRQRAIVSSPCADFLALPNLLASEVSIEFAAGDSGGVILNVTAQKVTRRIALVELDLFDRRKSEMNRRGGVLLGMAKGERVSADIRGMTKHIERLRKTLKSKLGITDNPILHQEGIGYSPIFKISDNRDAADRRAKREAERRTVSMDERQESGVQFRGNEHAESDYESEGDAADKWLGENTR